MKKNYERYFGNNIATVLYIISGVLIAGGLIGIFFRRWIVIMAGVTIIGVILFFITIRLKITDRDYDEVMTKASENYKKEFIEGKTVDRKLLDPEDFDVFSGYLFDKPGLKRKVGKDGKIRSSWFYVVAVRASRTEFMIFYSEYNVLEGTSDHRFIHGKQGNEIQLLRPESKPQLGDYRYVIRVGNNDGAEEFALHFPEDALVDKELKLIEDM